MVPVASKGYGTTASYAKLADNVSQNTWDEFRPSKECIGHLVYNPLLNIY